MAGRYSVASRSSVASRASVAGRASVANRSSIASRASIASRSSVVKTPVKRRIALCHAGTFHQEDKFEEERAAEALQLQQRNRQVGFRRSQTCPLSAATPQELSPAAQEQLQWTPVMEALSIDEPLLSHFDEHSFADNVDKLNGSEMLWLLGTPTAGKHRPQRLLTPRAETPSSPGRRSVASNATEDLSRSEMQKIGFWPFHGGYSKPLNHDRGAPVRAEDCEPGDRFIGAGFVGAQYTRPLKLRGGRPGPVSDCPIDFSHSPRWSNDSAHRCSAESVDLEVPVPVPSGRRARHTLKLGITADGILGVAGHHDDEDEQPSSPSHESPLHQPSDPDHTQVAFDDHTTVSETHHEHHHVKFQPSPPTRHHHPNRATMHQSGHQSVHQSVHHKHHHRHHEYHVFHREGQPEHHRHQHRRLSIQSRGSSHSDGSRSNKSDRSDKQRSPPKRSGSRRASLDSQSMQSPRSARPSVAIHNSHHDHHERHQNSRASVHSHHSHLSKNEHQSRASVHSHHSHFNHNDHHSRASVHSHHSHFNHNDSHSRASIHSHHSHFSHNDHHSRASIHSQHHASVQPKIQRQLTSDKLQDLHGRQKHQFLSAYSLGSELNSGAFSIVYNCRRRGEEFDMVAKFVDKAESQPDLIARESDFMKNLEHPCIAFAWDVYSCKCFVCIVMDKYEGGDLLQGVDRHSSHHGNIPCPRIAKLVEQALQPIVYLHSKSIIHLGIRAENYLIDRAQILDSDMKMVLTDFGTAQRLLPSERLCGARSGSEAYRAPEIWKHDYCYKVDVWALGVLAYLLHSHEVPFEDEEEICTRDVCTSGCLPVFSQFLRVLLAKDEDHRPSAAQTATHPFVKDDRPLNEVEFEIERLRLGTKLKPWERGRAALEKAMLASNGSQAGLLPLDKPAPRALERRRELVQRYEQMHAKRCDFQGNKDHGHDVKPRNASNQHEEQDAMKGVTLQWLPETRVAPQLVDMEEVSASETQEASTQAIGRVLADHGIDVLEYGQGGCKTLEDLTAEIRSGAARLMQDASQHKTLVRVVDSVLLRLAHRGDRQLQYLVQTREQDQHGNIKQEHQLPISKIMPYEHKRACAERMLFERLNMTDCDVVLDREVDEIVEEEEPAQSYPGLKTVHRKLFMDGMVTTVDTHVLNRIGFSKHSKAAEAGCEWKFHDFTSTVRSFTWLTEKEAKAHYVHIFPGHEADSKYQSSLVSPDLGMTELALWALLRKHGIDPSKYGKMGAKQVQELSDELSNGECTLLQLDGALSRMVESVHVRLHNKISKEVLIEVHETRSNGETAFAQALPFGPRRLTEDRCVAVRNLLKKRLKIEADSVSIDLGCAKTFEKHEDINEAHAGSPKKRDSVELVRRRNIISDLKTVQRTSVIHVEMDGPAAMFLDTAFTMIATANTRSRSKARQMKQFEAAH